MPRDRRPRRTGEPWWRPAPPPGADGDAGDVVGNAGATSMTLDHDLEPLAAALDAAGARARERVAGGTRNQPDPAFAAALRARLLSSWPGVEVPDAGSPRPATPATWQDADAGRVAGSKVAASRVASVTSVPDVRVRLAPRPTGQRDARLPGRRWGVLAVAAALLVGVVGLDGSRLFPGQPPARSADAVGAVLVRAGTDGPLLAGVALQAGDVIRVGAAGHALVDLAAGQARLAAGAEVRLITAAADRIDLEQVAGRVYHRVALASGGQYTVRTGALTWTARGTAFDLDRRPAASDAAGTRADAGGSEIVRAVGIQHDVRVEGAGLSATIAEGHSAEVRLGGETAELSVRAVEAAALADPWLLANARRDLEAGLPLGVMSGLAQLIASPAPSVLRSAAPVVVPSTAPTAPPTTVVPTQPPAGPTSAPAPTPTPTPRPTPRPTATPNPAPTPTPTPPPAPTLGSMSLSLTACEGRFVIATWSKWLGAGFSYYRGLRAASSSIPTAYPPGAGVVAPEGLYSNVQTTVTGLDQDLTAGSTYWYRAVAFDGADQALAASTAASTVAKPSKALGGLSVQATGPTATTFGWAPYPGAGACFTYYKLVYSASDPSPSYLTGSPYLWAGSTKTDSTVTIDGIAPGTYWFRLEALRSTSTGHILLASTDATSFTIP